MSMGEDEWLDAIIEEAQRKKEKKEMKVRVPDSFYQFEREPMKLAMFIKSNLQNRYNGVSQGQVEDLAADVDVLRECFTRLLVLFVEDDALSMKMLQFVLRTKPIERVSDDS